MSRRPEVELSDEAARYVEQHPGVIEKLAAGLPASVVEVSDEQRAKFRTYVRERLNHARSDEAATSGEAWLARHGLTSAQIR